MPSRWSPNNPYAGQGRGNNDAQAAAAWEARQNAAAAPTPAPQAETPAFDFASFFGGAFPSAPEIPQVDYAAELRAQEERNRITQGENDRDSAYTDYLDAANSATDFINTQIDQERSNAALLGVDYVISDEDKATRISDQFASIWGEGSQIELEKLFEEFGEPDGFDGFTIVRGEGSGEGDGEGGSFTTETTTARNRRRNISAAPEETLGGFSLLGSA